MVFQCVFHCLLEKIQKRFSVPSNPLSVFFYGLEYCHVLQQRATVLLAATTLPGAGQQAGTDRPPTPAAARSTSARGAWPASPRRPTQCSREIADSESAATRAREEASAELAPSRATRTRSQHARPDARQTVAASSCCVTVGRCGDGAEAEAHAPRATSTTPSAPC